MHPIAPATHIILTAGVEPATSRVSDELSDQLIYVRKKWMSGFWKKRRPRDLNPDIHTEGRFSEPVLYH